MFHLGRYPHRFRSVEEVRFSHTQKYEAVHAAIKAIPFAGISKKSAKRLIKLLRQRAGIKNRPRQKQR